MNFLGLKLDPPVFKDFRRFEFFEGNLMGSSEILWLHNRLKGPDHIECREWFAVAPTRIFVDSECESLLVI